MVRRPWAWYAKPSRDCAVAGLFDLGYSELYRKPDGHLSSILNLNLAILAAIGVALRVLAFLLLILCNRDKMGKRGLATILAARLLGPVSDACDDCLSMLHRPQRRG